MSKKILTILLILSLTLSFSFAQLPDITQISEGLNEFSKELSVVVPNAATQQGVWSDAWIGNFFPSVPPHFGGGFTLGIAKLNPEGLNKSISQLNLGGESKLPEIPSSLVLPTITADLKIGGVFLPFDLGLSVMKIPTVNLGIFGSGFYFDFFTVGASLRVPIIKGNLILPKVSIGTGFMYSKGSIGVSIENDTAFVNTNFETKTIFLEAQVSKKIAIVTPFVGLRAVISDSNNNWSWKYNVSFAGYTVGNEEQGNVSSSFTDDFFENLQPQIFAGTSLDFLFFQTTLSASFDVKNLIWGGNLSFRAKL